MKKILATKTIDYFEAELEAPFPLGSKAYATLIARDTFIISMEQSLKIFVLSALRSEIPTGKQGIFNLSDMTPQRSVPTASDIIRLCTNAQLTVGGDRDSVVTVWNNNFDGQKTLVDGTERFMPLALSFQQANNLLVGNDHEIVDWDLGSTTVCKRFKSPSPVVGIEHIDDHLFFSCGSKDKSVLQWDDRNDFPTQRYDFMQEKDILKFKAQAPYFVTVGAEETLKIWDTRMLSSHSPKPCYGPYSTLNPVADLSFTSNGRILALCEDGYLINLQYTGETNYEQPIFEADPDKGFESLTLQYANRTIYSTANSTLVIQPL
jgi:WD40 repeat protein